MTKVTHLGTQTNGGITQGTDAVLNTYSFEYFRFQLLICHPSEDVQFLIGNTGLS